MTDPIQLVQTYAAAAEEAMFGRDEAIVLARANGATLRTIANAAHMTPQGVAKVVDRKIGKGLL